MTTEDRNDYLNHLNSLLGKLATMLDVAPLGDDRAVFQRALDEVQAIRERVLANLTSAEPKPLIVRLAALERQATAQQYRLHIEDGLIDLIPSGWPQKGEAHSFRFNDAGIEAALAWLGQRAHPSTERGPA